MRTETDAESERDAILQAALSCFADLGYERTSIDDIVASSGLPAETILKHFADKAAMRDHLHSLWAERLSAWIVYG